MLRIGGYVCTYRLAEGIFGRSVQRKTGIRRISRAAVVVLRKTRVIKR